MASPFGLPAASEAELNIGLAAAADGVASDTPHMPSALPAAAWEGQWGIDGLPGMPDVASWQPSMLLPECTPPSSAAVSHCGASSQAQLAQPSDQQRRRARKAANQRALYARRQKERQAKEAELKAKAAAVQQAKEENWELGSEVSAREALASYLDEAISLLPQQGIASGGAPRDEAESAAESAFAEFAAAESAAAQLMGLSLDARAAAVCSAAAAASGGPADGDGYHSGALVGALSLPIKDQEVLGRRALAAQPELCAVLALSREAALAEYRRIVDSVAAAVQAWDAGERGEQMSRLRLMLTYSTVRDAVSWQRPEEAAALGFPNYARFEDETPEQAAAVWRELAASRPMQLDRGQHEKLWAAYRRYQDNLAALRCEGERAAAVLQELVAALQEDLQRKGQTFPGLGTSAASWLDLAGVAGQAQQATAAVMLARVELHIAAASVVDELQQARVLAACAGGRNPNVAELLRCALERSSLPLTEEERRSLVEDRRQAWAEVAAAQALPARNSMYMRGRRQQGAASPRSPPTPGMPA